MHAKILQAGKECNDILGERLRFETTWTVQEKIQWCKAVTDYIQCAGKHISNCSIIEVKDDVEQLSNFMEYIMKQANLYCHGTSNVQKLSKDFIPFFLFQVVSTVVIML